MRAGKTYGRVKRWFWQVSILVAATTGSEILATLQRGR